MDAKTLAENLHRVQEHLKSEVAQNERLRKALAFAASVIKSGESWTATCEDVIGSALRHER